MYFKDTTAPLLALFAFLFFAVAVLMSPERLSSVGLLDHSLASSNPLTRETALLEVRAAKAGLAILGGICLLLSLLWPRLSKAAWYRRFLGIRFYSPPAYEAHLGRVFTPSFWIMAGCFVLSAWYLASGNATFSRETLVWINREDGVIETASAVILLLASLLAARVAFGIDRRMLPQMLMHGFLALLFFAMCGEEISWGQRYLGLKTPEALQTMNVQQEINLHNMFGYAFDHIFILCFFIWGCVVPLLYRYSMFFRQLFRALGLPIPGAGLAIAMLVITLTQEQLTDPLLGKVIRLRVPELREFLSSVAFLLLMVESRRFLLDRSSERPQTAGNPVSRGPALRR
jgi:hypothetical protein